MVTSAHRKAALAAGVGLVALLSVSAGAGGAAGARKAHEFGRHSTRITNPYLPISKFQRCRLAGVDGKEHLHIKRTLLHRTKAFPYRGEPVRAAIVKDRVKARRGLIERTHDYFAQDMAGNVLYFGEDVNDYRHGRVVSHEGQWRLGRDTNRPGLLMPAHPKVGDVFRSEDVPHVTHERDHVVKRLGTSRAGGTTYHHVIKVRENARPPREVEYKRYARGTGVITEANGGLHLVGCTR